MSDISQWLNGNVNGLTRMPIRTPAEDARLTTVAALRDDVLLDRDWKDNVQLVTRIAEFVRSRYAAAIRKAERSEVLRTEMRGQYTVKVHGPNIENIQFFRRRQSELLAELGITE